MSINPTPTPSIPPVSPTLASSAPSCGQSPESVQSARSIYPSSPPQNAERPTTTTNRAIPDPPGLSPKKLAFLQAMCQNNFVVARASRALGISTRTGSRIANLPDVADALCDAEIHILGQIQNQDIGRAIADRRMVMERLTEHLLCEDPRLSLAAASQLARMMNMVRPPRPLRPNLTSSGSKLPVA